MSAPTMLQPTPQAAVCEPERAPAHAEAADGSKTWLTRARTFVTAISRVRSGSVLERAANPDEYMALLPDGTSATVQADGEALELDGRGDRLVIVPPGASRIEAQADGWVIRIFSHRAADLMAMAANAGSHPAQEPDEPPGPPPGGFRLRSYRLDEHVRKDGPARPFRSTNMLVNAFVPRDFRRDVRRMTPHAHEDFDQASLALRGRFVHHLRYPWSPDMTQWRDDEHIEVGSPSVIVMPAQVVHTTQDIGEGWVQLVDIFSPPRPDFIERPGWLCNEADYPS